MPIPFNIVQHASKEVIVLTEAEKVMLQAAIAEDGVLDHLEKQVVEKIKAYVKEGRVKYSKE